MKLFFTSDMHGHKERYEKLFNEIIKQQPEIVLLGGDLLPHFRIADYDEFINDYLKKSILSCKNENYNPVFLIILGNDDPRSAEQFFIEGEKQDYWVYLNMKHYSFKGYRFYGYSYVPPTPFLLKDWEKYDVSRYVDPGCIHPTEGIRTVDPEHDTEYTNIADDLMLFAAEEHHDKSIFLFHSPPYQTNLDRAALDGKKIDHVPLDVHVGSIAIRRFIEEKQPFITLHGHIHESTHLTGFWHDKIKNTWMFNGSTHFPGLSLIVIDTESPGLANRILI